MFGVIRLICLMMRASERERVSICMYIYRGRNARGIRFMNELNLEYSQTDHSRLRSNTPLHS